VREICLEEAPGRLRFLHILVALGLLDGSRRGLARAVLAALAAPFLVLEPLLFLSEPAGAFANRVRTFAATTLAQEAKERVSLTILERLASKGVERSDVLMVLTSPRQLTCLERGIEGYLDQLKEPMSPDSGFTVRLKRWVR
jgi:hypothetical protein